MVDDNKKDTLLDKLNSELQSNFSLVKIKHFCEVKDGTHDTPSYVIPSKDSFPLVTSKNIVNGELDFSSSNHISEADYIQINRRSNVEKYDVLMPMIGTIGNPAIVYTNKKFSIKNIALFKMNGNKEKSEFLKYLIESDLIQKQFNLLNRGGVQSFVSLNILKNLYIINDDFYKSIVSFLNKKTSEIDALIADKEKLIKLLEEKRQTIITEAVTKGLVPDVKMKDSGVEWIGDIPEHWNKKKIKYTTYVKGRIGWQGLKSDEFIDQGPYLVTGTDFKDGRVHWDSCHHISEERYEEAKTSQLQENDLLITKDGTIGKVVLVKNKPEKAILNSGIFVTRSLKGEYINEYMYWILLSDIFKNYVNYMGTGSTIKHL